MTGLPPTVEAGPARSPWILVSVLALGFAALVAGEWYFRFARYHFEMQLLHLPGRVRHALDAGTSQFTSVEVPPRSGGDLSALIGISRAASAYQETRPGGRLDKDPFGFVNRPYQEPIDPWAVVVGDSFMAKGLTDSIFASRLAELSEKTVYNRALIGHGPFLSVQYYLDDPRFRESPPEFLIWGFAEREIRGAFFERFRHSHLDPVASRETNAAPEAIRTPATPTRNQLIVHWHNLAPRQLQQSLPASSIFAQASQWVWNRLRFLSFGNLHPDLIKASRPIGDGPMLFYRYHVEAISTPESERNIPAVVEAITELDRICRDRGTRLVVVFIPEKEQVYRDALPARWNSAARPLPPSSLDPLAGRLEANGILAVNLLPEFRAAAGRGVRTYWRDDTHWNQAGIDLAAEIVWRTLAGAEGDPEPPAGPSPKPPAHPEPHPAHS